MRPPAGLGSTTLGAVMRRWNRWGEPELDHAAPSGALALVRETIGDGVVAPDARFDEVVARVPFSRLEPEAWSIDPADRVLHARGHSLPDWVALKSGRIDTFPDAVAHPRSAEDVRTLLDRARRQGLRVIPYGGGTSVVGHINPVAGNAPVLTVDLGGLGRMLALDETSRLATFEAGVRGPELERQLRERGYVLGHYPQSFEYSTLGGWIAARSSGQQSYRYGRIEDMFAGGTVETPTGTLELPALPASGAGPDLRQLVLGSEGRLGVVTQAIVRVRPVPAHEAFHAVVFDDWAGAVAAARAIAQAGLAVSMVRASDADETAVSFALGGGSRGSAILDRGLRLLGRGAGRCMMVFGVTGTRRATLEAAAEAYVLARAHGGLPAGTPIGARWRQNRFRGPYLRNTLWELGYAVDTLETAAPWAQISALAASIKQSLHDAARGFGERLLCFAHLSHVYRDGASIYVTYVFRRTHDAGELLARWRPMKAAASRAIVAGHGTISHQHGVGLDHIPYLEAEKSPQGMTLLAGALRALDPDGVMNPGKLVV